MDFTTAEQERERLSSQRAAGQITNDAYTAAVNALRVTDAAGNWWQPDPTGPGWLFWNGSAWGPGVPPVKSGLQPGTPKTFVEFQSRLMTVDEFKKMSKEVPLAKRPQKWWDLLSILGGITSAILWLLYSGIREGFDFLTPLLMIAIPVSMIWFREDLDVMLLPLQPRRKDVNKLLLVGIGMAFPFLTAFVLFNIGIRNYPLIQWNMIIGTFGAYAITRNPVIRIPGMAAQPGSGKPSLPAAHGILVALLAAVCSFLVLPVRADDCTRDILNAQDCLRTGGYAEGISGIASSAVSTSVNGQEIVRTLSGGGTSGTPPPSPPSQPPAQPSTPAETATSAQTGQQVPSTPQGPDSLPVNPDDAQNIKEAIEDTRAEQLRRMSEAAEAAAAAAAASAAAQAAAQQAARDKLLQNLQRMDNGMVEGTFAHNFTADDYSRISDQIDKVSRQLRSGGKVDVDLYSRIYRVYEGRVTGRTIPDGQIPSEAQIFRETVEGGIEGTSREIFTGVDADGKFSVKSMALRGLVGVATGGSSELAYTPASAAYTMKDYVDKGGDSVLGAFGHALKDVAVGELMGLGIGGVINYGGKYGGKLLSAIADQVPPSVTSSIKEGLETVTTPIKEGFEKVKDVLNTEIKNPFAAAATDLPPGLSGYRVPPKTEGELFDAVQNARKGEPAPGLSDVSFKPAGKPPDLDGMTVRDQKVVRMVADKHGVDVHMRPTNPESRKWIESGNAHPKPEALKTKTIDADDVQLGFSEDSKGLVACREPVKPPEIKPPDMPDDQFARLQQRYDQRVKEFGDQADHLRDLQQQGRIKWDEKTGIITDARTGKPFAGDNDPFAYVDSVTKKPVSPYTVNQINKDLQANGATLHNEHVNWDISGKSNTPGVGGAQSDFSTAAAIDNKILKGHSASIPDPATGQMIPNPGAKPLNTYNPLSGKWETNWFTGDTRRSFAEPVTDAAGKITGYLNKAGGGT